MLLYHLYILRQEYIDFPEPYILFEVYSAFVPIKLLVWMHIDKLAGNPVLQDRAMIRRLHECCSREDTRTIPMSDPASMLLILLRWQV